VSSPVDAADGPPGPPGPVDDGADDRTDDGIDSSRRRRLSLIGVWLLVAFGGVVTALEVGTWLFLRSLDVDRMWRAVGCTSEHPCRTAAGQPVTRPIPAAGHLHLAGVALVAVVTVALVVATERAVRRSPGRPVATHLALAALVSSVLAVAVQADRLHGLPFNRFDGAYSTTYFFFMASNLTLLSTTAVLLFGLWNRARLGRYDDGDPFPVRLVRILTVGAAAAVCTLVVVASVFS